MDVPDILAALDKVAAFKVAAFDKRTLFARTLELAMLTKGQP
jgi:hypothetical protein